jgi:excinuclease ABC subunit B
MREAAADLNFEEAARLRDEIKRLRATELAVVDDPTARTIVATGRRAPRKPGLDEMGPGIESIPGKAGKTGPRSTSGRPGTRAWRGKKH